MSEDYYPLFRLLVGRTRMLAIVCDNAAEVLSEQFQDMITGPLSAVQEVLAQCPDVMPWNGSFEDSDIIIEHFMHHTQQAMGPPQGVRLRHVPSDLSVESYSKLTAAENEAVARRALEERVRYKWMLEQQAIQAQRRP